MRRPPSEADVRTRSLARGLFPHARAFYESYALDAAARDPFYKPSSRI